MALRLLFVEDNAAQRTLFKDALDEWNNDHPEQQFDLILEVDYQAALVRLESTRFDCALLDLRLPGGATNTVGQDLAEMSVSGYGIPAAIISGNPAEIIKGSVVNRMLAIFDKGDGDAYEKAIAWFGSQWKMMEILRETRKTIQTLGAGVFAGRVWPRWQSYESLEGIEQKLLINIVSRQYASHIAEIMGLDIDDGVNWHPFENYVQPALLDSRPHTGDIFLLKDQLWVVLTPQCDMATQKVSVVLLAKCDAVTLADDWKKHIAGSRADASNGAKKDAEKFFKALVNQNEPSRHFLPPLEAEKPIIVEFKNLTIVPLEELKAQLDKRIASIAPPFLTNMTQRFGSYVSRVGQPNIDIKHFR